jgi:hypothetical protein
VTLGPLSPAWGLNQGICVWQDRTLTTQPPIGIVHTDDTNKWNITGCIYAANGRVSVSRSNGDISVGSQFICDRLILDGTGDMTVTGNFVKTRMSAGVE